MKFFISLIVLFSFFSCASNNLKSDDQRSPTSFGEYSEQLSGNKLAFEIKSIIENAKPRQNEKIIGIFDIGSTIFDKYAKNKTGLCYLVNYVNVDQTLRYEQACLSKQGVSFYPVNQY